MSVSLDIGNPIHVQFGSVRTDTTADEKEKEGEEEELLVSFDWRKIWTMKCAPLRKLEERQEELRKIKLGLLPAEPESEDDDESIPMTKAAQRRRLRRKMYGT